MLPVSICPCGWVFCGLFTPVCCPNVLTKSSRMSSWRSLSSPMESFMLGCLEFRWPMKSGRADSQRGQIANASSRCLRQHIGFIGQESMASSLKDVDRQRGQWGFHRGLLCLSVEFPLVYEEDVTDSVLSGWRNPMGCLLLLCALG
jgi:hypothetical protein